MDDVNQVKEVISRGAFIARQEVDSKTKILSQHQDTLSNVQAIKIETGTLQDHQRIYRLKVQQITADEVRGRLREVLKEKLQFRQNN